MGVYIKGMKMPTSCRACQFAGFGGRRCELNVCMFTGESQPTLSPERMSNCPLIPVPPHGDLIDRDVLRKSIGESIEECHKWADEVDKDTMMYARISQSLGTFVECSLRAKAAPTIIPAEEGE